jgi:hypothetical protein
MVNLRKPLRLKRVNRTANPGRPQPDNRRPRRSRLRTVRYKHRPRSTPACAAASS